MPWAHDARPLRARVLEGVLLLCHAPEAAHLQVQCAPQPHRRVRLRAQHMPHRQRLEPCPAPEFNGVQASAAAMTATRDRQHRTHRVAASRAGCPPDAPGACIAAAAMATSTSARIAHGLLPHELDARVMVDVPTQHAAQQVAQAGLRQCRISTLTLTSGNARDTLRVLLRHRARAPYHPTPALRRWNARSGNRASRRSWSSCERCTSSGSILPCATRQVGRVARAVTRRCPSRKYYV